MASARQVALEVTGREVVITNPDKVFFPHSGHTKLDLARYYAAVADGALRGIAGRPIVLKRYVDGPDGARDRGPRRGAAPVDRQPRVHRPEPAPGPRRRPRASRRAARRSRPGRWRELGRRATCGPRRP